MNLKERMTFQSNTDGAFSHGTHSKITRDGQSGFARLEKKTL